MKFRELYKMISDHILCQSAILDGEIDYYDKETLEHKPIMFF